MSAVTDFRALIASIVKQLIPSFDRIAQLDANGDSPSAAIAKTVVTPDSSIRNTASGVQANGQVVFVSTPTFTLTAAHHFSTIVVLHGACSLYLPKVSDLWNGFKLEIISQNGVSTLYPNAADTFNNSGAGVPISLILGQCSQLKSDGSNNWTQLFSVANSGAQYTYFATGTSNQTVIETPWTFNVAQNNLAIYIAGVLQLPTDYTLTDTTHITLSEPLVGGESIAVYSAPGTGSPAQVVGTLLNSMSDSTANYLSNKVVAGEGMQVATQNAGSAETLKIRPIDTMTSISGNTNVTSANHKATYLCTAALGIGLPTTASVFNGFSFTIFAQGGDVTLTPNAADSIQGASNGTPYTITAGNTARLVTNGTGNWWLLDLAPTQSVNSIVATRMTINAAFGGL